MKKINGSVIQDGFFAMKTAKGSQTVKTMNRPRNSIHAQKETHVG